MSFKTFQNIAGAALIALAVSCNSKEKGGQGGPGGPGAMPAVDVSVDTVDQGDAVYLVQYPGTVTALKEVTLLSQVSGYVTGIYFQDGQHVSQGEKLYTIDPQIYNANTENANAELEVQRANLLKAQKDADRYHKLDEQDAIAKQQVDYADAALAIAKKQVAAAQAQVNSIGANVKFSTIRAPFSGTIGISSVRVGTSVVAGQTQLNAISTDDPMAVDFNVNQAELYRFEKIKSNGGGAKEQMFSLAFGQDIYPEHGRITLIDRAVDPQTGTVKVRLSFNNNKGMLKPGMTATVRVKSANEARAILVPNKAIVEQLGEYYVYKVMDSSKVTQTKVQLGEPIGSNIIINDGLEVGDIIVTEGQQKLAEGAKVNTAGTKAAAKAQGGAAPAKK